MESHQQTLSIAQLQPITEEERQTVDGLVDSEDIIIREEMDYDVSALRANVGIVTMNFNADQQTIYHTIMNAVCKNESLQIFISARGGCGKTYLLNGILDAVRASESGGCIALAMASTGIAAELLHLGRTFHSRLKAPLNPNENSTLNITAQSKLAKLVRRAKLLMIDEVTMLHRFQLEALDRTLRDLMEKPNAPFGGKIIILAGDFRQCLPIVVGGNRAQIVQSCINKSPLWKEFQVYIFIS